MSRCSPYCFQVQAYTWYYPTNIDLTVTCLYTGRCYTHTTTWHVDAKYQQNNSPTPVASPGFVARRGQRWKLGHGALTVDFRAGCRSVLMTNSFVTNAVLIERAVSCGNLRKLLWQTIQYLAARFTQKWTKNEIVLSRGRGGGGTCPITPSITGDATDQRSNYTSLAPPWLLLWHFNTTWTVSVRLIKYAMNALCYTRLTVKTGQQCMYTSVRHICTRVIIITINWLLTTGRVVCHYDFWLHDLQNFQSAIFDHIW